MFIDNILAVGTGLVSGILAGLTIGLIGWHQLPGKNSKGPIIVVIIAQLEIIVFMALGFRFFSYKPAAFIHLGCLSSVYIAYILSYALTMYLDFRSFKNVLQFPFIDI